MSVARLLPAAWREVQEATDWYEQQRPGLGLGFVSAIDQTVRAVGESPGHFAVWGENPRYRRAVVDRFPYVVFFHLVGEVVEIVAVAHARREPGYWLRRL